VSVRPATLGRIYLFEAAGFTFCAGMLFGTRAEAAGLSMNTSGARWYVVQCKPREDARALEHLERQGYTCFLPVLAVEKLRHRRKVEVSEPLFPGYLFISLNTVYDNWHSIRSTRGVLQLVRFNDYPVPVPDHIVHAIQVRAATQSARVPLLKPGERVRITEGCFSDLEAIYVANDGGERVVLLMKILHREQTLSFPLASIRKVKLADVVEGVAPGG
jgi:transcriptional antiterminator RfaH